MLLILKKSRDLVDIAVEAKSEIGVGESGYENWICFLDKRFLKANS